METITIDINKINQSLCGSRYEIRAYILIQPNTAIGYTYIYAAQDAQNYLSTDRQTTLDWTGIDYVLEPL